MPLQFSAGHATLVGPRKRNEDFCGMVMPRAAELEAKGALFALADGVGGNPGGREAAEYTVRGLLADYYATPDTWSVPHALDRVLYANNRWLLGQSASRRELAGMACTLSALVLRGRRFFVAHVGDSRVYLLRDARLERLTVDHVWDHPQMQNVLTRAVGMGPHLTMDYCEHDLQPGDVFALMSDGVWEPLGERAIHEALELRRTPERAAQALAEAALARGGRDNASAVVVKIESVGDDALHDVLSDARRLQPPSRLAPGQTIDGFEVVSLLHESRVTLLYQVRNQRDGTLAVLKTVQPALASDPEQCAALLAEQWLSRRVISHYFAQPLPVTEQNYLYCLLSYHEGATLQQRLDAGAHFSVADTVRAGIRILKGLGALHRLFIVHRDIKPSNIHLGADDKLRILDLGVAWSHGTPHAKISGTPGTPSFMAPELLAGEGATAQTDLYATGVTLYHLLTRKYPYGEIEPFQHPKFGDPVSPNRFRPDIPQWLEAVLLKAVARDPKLRFETAEEFLLALERGERQPLGLPARTPLLEREPALLWRSVALVLLIANLLLLYYLVVR